MKSAISISNLSFSYEKNPILEGIDFFVEKGKFIGVIGPNGCGKTTLLKLILGFLKPTKGQILLFGKKPELSKHLIGYVPQLNRTDPDFPITVLELVMLGLITNTRAFQKNAKENALYWIEKLGLYGYRFASFSSLSGGFAQRALLARALVSDPDLLILDEPTANVDAKSKEMILDILYKFRGEKTILLVTHDYKTSIERVDQILCVDKQAIIYQPQDVCSHFALGLYHPPLQSKLEVLHVP